MDHHHSYPPRPGDSRVLFLALGLTATYAVVEAIGGWLAGSLALLADAGHMVSDTIALALAATASVVAQRPATPRHSYGFGRFEVVAATVNALFLAGVVVMVAVAAVGRLRNPTPVAGGLVLVIAGAGLVLNIVVAWVLSRGRRTLNVRAAMLHVFGDLLGSLAAFTSGIVILATGWTPIDPILSLLICTLILVSCVRLLREALGVVLESVPREIELEKVGRAIAGVDGVRQVHDLHIWQVASDNVILTAHLVVDSLDSWEAVRARVAELLRDSFAIKHVTLQPELTPTVVVRNQTLR